MVYGVKSVTMDDIAREAGVSKKTIYLEFTDKGQLVFETFSKSLEEDECRLRLMEEDADGVIGNLIEMSQFIREKFAEMNPTLLIEIKRYYPACWKRFEQFKEEQALEGITALLERGKSLGYFRPEINSRILAMLRLEQISLLFDPHKFSPSKHNLLEVQLEIFDHFLYGIFTEKGRLVYLEKLNQKL